MRLLFALLLLTACSPSVSSTLFLPAPPAPKPDTASVVVFQSKLPECPFQEIGTVAVHDKDGAARTSKLLPAMRARARRMGGDAILGYTQELCTTGAVLTGNAIVGSERKEQMGTVIRFTDPACRR